MNLSARRRAFLALFLLLSHVVCAQNTDEVTHFSFPARCGDRMVQMEATVEFSHRYGGWGVRIGNQHTKVACIPTETSGHIYLPDSLDVPDGRRLAVKWTADGAFQDCVHITGVRLPENLVFLSVSTFRGCTSLREIVIPAGTSYIYPYAFAGCDNLRRIRFLPMRAPTSYVEQDFSDRYKHTCTLVYDARAFNSYSRSLLTAGFHYHAEILPMWGDTLTTSR